MKRDNYGVGHLALTGLIGGLMGALVVSMIGSPATVPNQSEAVIPGAGDTAQFVQIHEDLQRLIELAERPTRPIESSRQTSQREVVPAENLPAGLVPAMASLEASLRALIVRDGGSLTDTVSSAVTAAPPVLERDEEEEPDISSMIEMATEVRRDRDGVRSRYFGSSVSQIFAEFGQPSRVTIDEKGMTWRYTNIGGDSLNRFHFRIYDRMVYEVF